MLVTREANAIVLQAIRFAYNFSGVEVMVRQNDWVDVSFDMDLEKLKFELPQGYETLQGSEEFRKLCYLVTTMLVPSMFFNDIRCMPWIAMALSAVFELSYSGTDHIELMRWEMREMDWYELYFSLHPLGLGYGRPV